MSSLSGKASTYKNQILKILSKTSKDVQASFHLNISNGLTVNCRSGELENIENQNDTGLSIEVFNNNRKGTASTNDLSLDSIEKTLSKASNIAKHTQADSCQGLPSESYIKEESGNLGIYFPVDIKMDEIIELTKSCEAAAFEKDDRIKNSEGSSFTKSENETMLLNSEGLFGYYKSTHYSLSCIVLANEGDSMERDYWYSSTREFNKLEHAREVGQRAASRASSRLNAKPISSRVCPVIFPPEVATSLIGNLLSSINGHSIYKKSSFLIDSLGKDIFPEFVCITENPDIPNAMGSRPFDDDGVLTQKKNIIEKGRLMTFLLDTYSARKLNEKCTGNGVITNITVESKKNKNANLIKMVDEGIIITEMMGSGANLLTGDYSRGAFGFYFKDGEIKYPVTGITVASNLTQMFKNILEIGSDVDFRGNIRTGSILVDNVTIGGT